MSNSDSSEFSSLARTAILQTLQNWFQSESPVSRGLISAGDPPSIVEMFWIDATTMEHPFQTIFSAGLSDRPLVSVHGNSAFSRIELIMHLPLSWPAKGKRLQLPEYQWPEVWLRTLACSIANGSILLPGPQVIISNDEPPTALGSGTEQTCLLLLADFYQCFPVEISDKEKIHFYHVVPLYSTERDFEKANGVQALLEAMATKGLVSLVIDPCRDRFA